MPYLPGPALAALRHYHEDWGDRLWGDYGFLDSFCPTRDWVAPGHIAIDQGPIVVMIENHRSALLWRLFMAVPEIAPALARMGLTRNPT
jgi:hypothetical protein